MEVALIGGCLFQISFSSVNTELFLTTICIYLPHYDAFMFFFMYCHNNLYSFLYLSKRHCSITLLPNNVIACLGHKPIQR